MTKSSHEINALDGSDCINYDCMTVLWKSFNPRGYERQGRGNFAVTPFTRLHGLLSIARKPFVGGSINWALSLPFFTLQSIYLLSYVLFSVANPPFRLPPPPSCRLISIAMESCRQPHLRDSITACVLRESSLKRTFCRLERISRERSGIKWLQFFRSTRLEAPIS